MRNKFACFALPPAPCACSTCRWHWRWQHSLQPPRPGTQPPPLPALPACPVPCPALPALQRLLDYIKPDKVHIMQDGRIVTTGDMGLVDQLELEGYSVLSSSG